MSEKARAPTVRDLAAAYGPKALEQLARLAGLIEGNPGASSEATRVAALTQLLDRAYGKATQPIAAETDEQSTEDDNGSDRNREGEVALADAGPPAATASGFGDPLGGG